jgi:hypothetical protein
VTPCLRDTDNRDTLLVPRRSSPVNANWTSRSRTRELRRSHDEDNMVGVAGRLRVGG